MDHIRNIGPELLHYWSDYDCRLVEFCAPEELAVGIEPATGILTEPRSDADLGVACVRVAWRPDEIEVAQLAHGGVIWLSCWGGLPPHMLEVQPPAGTSPDA